MSVFAILLPWHVLAPGFRNSLTIGDADAVMFAAGLQVGLHELLLMLGNTCGNAAVDDEVACAFPTSRPLVSAMNVDR